MLIFTLLWKYRIAMIVVLQKKKYRIWGSWAPAESKIKALLLWTKPAVLRWKLRHVTCKYRGWTEIYELNLTSSGNSPHRLKCSSWFIASHSRKKTDKQLDKVQRRSSGHLKSRKYNLCLKARVLYHTGGKNEDSHGERLLWKKLK